ncbi:hypothetical protein ABBQ38_013959 [Trebouxia sp. C0009 RCD-2024]
MPPCLDVGHRRTLRLENAYVPVCCLPQNTPIPNTTIDSLALVDIDIADGFVTGIFADGVRPTYSDAHGGVVNMRHGIVLPTFVDLHTHIDKAQTGERSRNIDGTLSGADRSTASDAEFWNQEDVYRRMDFSLKCAYAHGTSAVRTHLINMAPKQIQLTWPCFQLLKEKWKGKVELQGVSLVVLSFFRDLEAATELANTVAAAGGIMGAAVCCAENGGDPDDDWTTCDRDRDILLDRIFTLAKERNLDLDFHVDENGNERAKGLLYIARKTIQHGYQGRVVCGHCCSLCYQSPQDLEVTMEATREAGITVVALPLVNQWTQDRDQRGQRTPRWRGLTLLHELRSHGIPVAIASDNTRDQFYAYGDLDMLEVFNQACRMAHLDRPYKDWALTVGSVPADAMRLPQHGRIAPSLPANLVLFKGRGYSELLARPQWDRVVLRNGVPIDAEVPDYRELDTVPNERRYTADQPVLTLGPADPPSNPPRSPSSGSITSNDAAFSKQPPVDERDSVIAALNAKVSSAANQVMRSSNHFTIGWWVVLANSMVLVCAAILAVRYFGSTEEQLDSVAT